MAQATAQLNQARVDAFAEQITQVLNGGSMALMLSIGHRTGLFDAMADMPPATSSEIAEQAGLQERYVREWLGAMVTGRVVEYDAKAKTYHLPPEHASLVTRQNAPNFAATMQWFSVLGHIEDGIVDCFYRGGGMAYDDYHRFHEVMAEESAQTVLPALIEHILPLSDGLTARLEEGIDVLDIGCGSGRALCRMAEEFPKSRFTGYDMCQDAVDAGQETARENGLKNLQFACHDVSRINQPERFDLITAFDAIHDQARPDVVLRQICQSLKPDGVFLMQDILASSHVEKNLDNPVAPFLYTISCMHCMSVSLGQGGAGLGAAWGRELAERMLAEAGFRHVEVHKLPHDDLNYYYIARK